MARTVKPRSYDSAARRSASRERQARIFQSAREIFVERGYPGATMVAIAERAGVALDTVYELVGPKPELFRLLIETAISGQDRVVPAEQRQYVQDLQAEPTARGKLRIYAMALPQLHARLAPLVAVLQAAASAEPKLAELWTEISERRATNMHRFAVELHQTGELGVSVDHAADVIWATNSPELYLLLVRQREWTADQYSDWLADSWERLLLVRASPRIGGLVPGG